ncbi:MAG: hypothetical protein WEC36_16010 [Phycisphaeraceae bacterium]
MPLPPILTVTSDNYLPCTRLLLESLRVWHAETAVTVYALERGWTPRHTAQIEDAHTRVRVLAEPEARHRQGGAAGNYAVWKIDVFAMQTQPFLFLDSDILVLAPLLRVAALLRRDGWFSVQEGTPLSSYYQGLITRLMSLPPAAAALRSFNTGVLACDPCRHQALFGLARDWGRQVSGMYLGDQGLLNLAWYQLYGLMPPPGTPRFNGGWGGDDRVDLSQVILHFARPNYPPPGGGKLLDQQRIWRAWPKGVPLLDLTDTDFWRRSLPHPWQWLNQCTLPRHRRFVRQMRAASLALRGCEHLLIADRYQAYLLHPKVLAEVASFWARSRHLFVGLPHRPTFNLNSHGQLTSAWARRWPRLRSTLRAHLPI